MRTRRYNGWMVAIGMVAAVCTAGLTLATAPAQAQEIARYHEATRPRHVSELPAGLTQCLTPSQWKAVDAQREKQARQRPDVRLLSDKEMRQAHGRGNPPLADWGPAPATTTYRNQYLCGTLPWQRSLRDVNLCTGNLFKSFTDIQVQPAVGAGLALQRTYNSDDATIGPFGEGWTHAYDIRMTEENPTTNQTDTTLNYSDRVDFFGNPFRYHRDADGLYTPPAFMYDVLTSNYFQFLVNGPVAATDDYDYGMDGTIKHYTTVYAPGNQSGTTIRACDYIKDRFGNTTTLTYNTGVTLPDGTHPLATVTDPSGRTLTFTTSNLAAQGQPAVYRVTEVDGPLYRVTYSYDPNFNLHQVTQDPGGTDARVTTYGYGSSSDGLETNLLTSVADGLGHTVSYSYSCGTTLYGTFYPWPTNSVWVTSVQEPAGVDANNTPRTQTWTLLPFYSNSPCVSVTSDGGIGFTLVSDGYLRKSGFNTGTGGTISPYSAWGSSYDSANNVTNTQMPYNSGVGSWLNVRSDTFTYGTHGNVLTHVMDGYTSYNGQSNVKETTQYYNADHYFMKSSFTDFNNHTTSWTVGSTTDPNVGNRGNILAVQDAGYNDSSSPSYHLAYSYAYDSHGRKISETNLGVNNSGVGVVSNYTYGGLTDATVTWPDGHQAPAGNLTQVIQDPNPQGQSGHLARTTTLSYDLAGHVTQSTDPANLTSSFVYNNVGQPTEATFPANAGVGGEQIFYGYDANGRASTVQDNRGTTSILYETGSDRVSSVSDPRTGTVGYLYNKSGGRTSMSLPGGGSWSYVYATTGNTLCFLKDDPNAVSLQLVTLYDDGPSGGRRVDVSLDHGGHPVKVTSNQTFTTGGNPTLTAYQETDYTYEFDSPTQDYLTTGYLPQLQTSYHKLVNGTWTASTLANNGYVYNAGGERLSNAVTQMQTSGSPTTWTEGYTYDDLDRLATVSYSDNSETQSYGFDAMGNRMSKQDSITGTENYTYNAANMLLSRGANTYTNDADGNTLTGGGRTNTWDSQNRLVSCALNNTGSTFGYGADGIRHEATVAGTLTESVLDTGMLVREQRGGSNYATYFVGPQGPQYRRDDTTGNVRWYVFDGVGSVSEEVDPNGNVTAARKYDVFGSVRSGQSGTSSQKFVGSLGHVSEDSTGLIYMRARYMDPVTGRFISEDPAQDETNWFLYCGNAPTNKYDPTGCGGQIIDIGGGWWIRIDDPTSGSLPFERDLHWGNRSGDLGSVFENDTWKHFKGNLPTNRVKKAAAQAGWRGLLEGLAVCSVVAYFQQNPLDCIAILLDCAGDFDMANRVDQLNASL